MPQTMAPPRSPADRRRSVHAKALELVRLALEMTTEAGSGHPTSAASLAHLVTVLLYDHMRWDPARPDAVGSDRLILSEGHACPIVYAACADLGVSFGRERRRKMTREDALTLRAIDSPIDGHPNPLAGFPFFPAATGSLGQGLSIAAGMALAARLDGRGCRFYCLIGDGESREGQVWEALDMLAERELTAVCPIFNANGFGQTGAVAPGQRPEALARKLAAFGLEPRIIDGHDPDAIREALEQHAERARGGGAPIAIVARTVKGYGTPSLASQPSGMHGQAAEAGGELERALSELDARARELGAEEVRGALRIPPPPAAAAEVRAGRNDGLLGFRQAMVQAGFEKALETKRVATRKAYGAALRALGLARPDVVVLDGDVSNSTFAEVFADEDALRERFIECRIAEQNLVSCAAGLAAGGKVAFASSFGKFLSRAYDQLEMALVGGQAVRLVGSHVGIGPAADGPSQMALSDAAWFAALARVERDGRPLLHVLTPADACSAYSLTLEAARGDRSVYLRTLRTDVPLLYEEGDEFPIGGHRVVQQGRDVLLVAWGYVLHEVLRAAEALRERGVEATVVDLYSLPFDGERVVALARENGGRVLCVEDNYGGALGGAVAEVLAAAGAGIRLEQLYVRRVPKSGRSPEDLLEYLGLSRPAIVEAALRLVR
jgi:transketolase